MSDLTFAQMRENGFWVYDPEIDAPRLATPHDFDQMKAMQAALFEYRFILRTLDAHKPGPDANAYLAWIRRIKAAIDKVED